MQVFGLQAQRLHQGSHAWCAAEEKMPIYSYRNYLFVLQLGAIVLGAENKGL